MINVDVTRTFLTLLDPTAQYFTFQVFPERYDCDEVPWVFCGSFGVVKHSLDYMQGQGCGVFVTVNHMRRGDSRKIADLERIRAVWCDWDNANRVPPPWPIEPHMVVESSPGKYHFYWLTDNMHADEHQAIMSRIVAMGGDNGAKDLVRVLRLPGTLHQKDDPFEVGLLACNKELPRYTPAELMKAFGATLKPAARPTANLTTPIPQDLAQLAIDAIVAQAALKTHQDGSASRHAYVYWVGRRMRESGVQGASEHFEYALEQCQAKFRPCDTQGEAKEWNLKQEMKALRDGYEKGGDGRGLQSQTSPSTLVQPPKEEVKARTEGEEGAQAITGHDYRHNHEFLQIIEDQQLIASELEPSCVTRLAAAHDAAAMKPQPKLARLAAISALSVPLLRRYRTPTDAPAAIYALAIAPTSEGKEQGKRLIEEVADRWRHAYRVKGKYKSDSGIDFSLADTPAQLAVLDEFGNLVRFSKSTSGGHMDAVLSRLIELFNQRHGLVSMGSYSKRGMDVQQAREAREKEQVFAPTIGLYCMTTPDTLLRAAGVESLLSGMLNRFLVAISSEYPRTRIPKPIDFDPQMLGWATAVKERWDVMTNDSSQESFHAQPVEAIRLDWTEEAKDAWMELWERISEIKQRVQDERVAAMLGRTAEKAVRVATIVALGEDPECTHIPEDIMRWASAYSLMLDLEMIVRVGEDIAENETEATHKRLLKIIRQSPGQTITAWKLYKKTRWITAKARSMYLQDMLACGEIMEIRTPSDRKGGRPTISYTAA